MSVTLRPTGTHRNPSGMHNKVNWLLVTSGYDEKMLDRLMTLICPNLSWEVAYYIALCIINREFNNVRERYPLYWRWAKKYVNKLRYYRMEQKNAKRKDFS